MGYSGPEFYDDDLVFAAYMRKREHPEIANRTLEKPVFDELVGSLERLRILDLGCGDARYGREALERGCRSYLGIEGSQKMWELAEVTLAETSGEVIHANIEDWSYPSHAFDLVTSRLVLHYIQDLNSVLMRVHHSLEAGGRFVFSVEHPVITACDRAWEAGGVRKAWIVDDYFETGLRVTSWMGGEVIKYHRTVEDYFSALVAEGFLVDAVRESRPQRERFTDEGTYKRRMHIPLMLFFSAHRPERS